MEDDVMKRYQVPAFGHWNWSFDDDAFPISDYLGSHFFAGDHKGGFFKVLSPYSAKVKQGGMKVKCVETKARKKAKATDEDLYEIPAELLYQMPKKKKVLWNFCAGCLCLGCIA